MATEFRHTAGESGLIFRCTIERLHSATMPEVDPNEQTAVVRVEEVYRGPAALGIRQGQPITVVLKESASVRPGEQLVFEATGWLYGTSLAVVEVSRRAVDPAPSPLRKLMEDEVGRQSEGQIRARISEADLIVEGQVVGLAPDQRAGPRAKSEHDPDWWVATVRVDGVLAGKHAAKTVEVVFPNSEDVAWYQAPKARAGQQGLWILRTRELEGREGSVLTALHPLDFVEREHERLAQVRSLISEVRG